MRKVRRVRPFAKRYPGWIALVATAAIFGSGEYSPAAHLIVTLPVTVVAFLASGVMSTIYEVPPRHRTPPPGDKQSGGQDNVSGK